MQHGTRKFGWLASLVVAGLCLVGAGCQVAPVIPAPVPADVPRELELRTLPAYVIGPPDILQIEAVVLKLNNDGVPISTERPTPLWPQPVTGQFLVRPDGTVGLGVYGSTQLAGLTLEQARESIQGFLAYVTGLKPQALAVAVDVVQFNSKTYYVITDGAGFGEGVARFPVTGSETVLDAISQIQGLPQVASKRHVWVARRAPGCDADQMLPVDWCAITRVGDTRTNYQLLPGDRLYVMAQPIIHANNWLQKVLAPVQQALGITLLGSETVNSIKGIR
ncbi:MAG TPA: polysaccharide biosynthesis/export family protein [Planctomycetota bacterium]|jgi:polysaccharide export outer membrane protein|nr:polysaccharide biosynthesis/export family protein [Planctomycetota bacterium]